MKLTDAQRETLEMLMEKPAFRRHHPKDKFKLNTLQALEKKGLVESYQTVGFLNGAVRITAEGKNILTTSGEELD